jgi:hypothetical protein
MSISSKLEESPRGLSSRTLKTKTYKILSVSVATELDSLLRRFAKATVITKNSDGEWDENSTHLIDLKHCYNKASRGPNHTPYHLLPGKVILIADIQEPQYGDLYIVRWEFLN